MAVSAVRATTPKNHLVGDAITNIEIVIITMPVKHVPTDHHDLTAIVVRALVLYCLAEFQLGHATTIRVTAAANSFSVADDGRGHSIERAVDGTPYLKFIYTHFDYPFESDQSPPVQLQGIGMSLINVLCSELMVTVRRQDATLQMWFRDGRPAGSELKSISSGETGVAVSGTVGSQLQDPGVDVQRLELWLLGLLPASPLLKLFFNGNELHAVAQNDANTPLKRGLNTSAS